MAMRIWASSMANALRLSRSSAAPLQSSVFARYFASKVPADLKYVESHEWISNDNGVVTIGITDHAQAQLGDLVYVELNAVGSKIAKEDAFGSVESVKATSEVYAPVSGEIVETNPDLSESPDSVNSDPYGKGWLVKVKLSDPSELNNLLDAAAYTKFCEEDTH